MLRMYSIVVCEGASKQSKEKCGWVESEEIEQVQNVKQSPHIDA